MGEGFAAEKDLLFAFGWWVKLRISQAWSNQEQLDGKDFSQPCVAAAIN